MRTIDLVICDLDGTLVDSFPDIREGLRHAFTRIGVAPSPELLALSLRGVSLEIAYEHATGAHHTTPREQGEFQRFVDTYRQRYFERSAHSRPFPGVETTLRALRRAHPNTRFGVATAKRTDMARRVVESAGLLPYFDVVRGSDGLPHKPDPAILEKVAEDTASDLTGALMVGDTDKDVLAAQRAGAVSVAVTYGGWDEEELSALGPDHLINGFRELETILRRG